MDLLQLKNTLTSYYEKTDQVEWLGDDQLVVSLPDSVWFSMIDRNPTVTEEVKKLNSSTALAVNYYQMLSELTGVEVEYEVVIAVPLMLTSGKGHPAMIDARYDKDGVSYFVESKFLEPYYSLTHEVSLSYMMEKYYECPEEACKWVSLFKTVQTMIDYGEFTYFDINQMLKHLLAIYRTKHDGPVVLKNMIWKPTDRFYSVISKRSASYLKKRSEKLTEEMKAASSLMNAFVHEELGWDDCSVEIGYYNAELDIVSSHNQFGRFEDKYLL